MAKKGTGLTISQRANGRWRAQIRKKGFPAVSADFISHEAADEWGLRKLAEIQQVGRLVDRSLAESTTFGQLIDIYIDKVVAKRATETSRVSETARLKRFQRVEAKLCAYAVSHISWKMMEDWAVRRLEQEVSRGEDPRTRTAKPIPAGRFRKDGTLRANAAKPKDYKPLKTVSPSTVKREMIILKRVFDYAMKHFNLSTNPLAVELVTRPVAQDERDARIPLEAQAKLLDACRQSENPWLAPAFELALKTGARRSSLLKLKWKDVDLDRGVMTLIGVKNSRKPTEIRTVSVGLGPRAIEILRALPRSIDGQVFPCTDSALASAFKRAREIAGLPNVRFHDTRHELASVLVEAGWQLSDVMKQCDWRDVKSVMRYYGADGAHLANKLSTVRGM